MHYILHSKILGLFQIVLREPGRAKPYTKGKSRPASKSLALIFWISWSYLWTQGYPWGVPSPPKPEISQKWHHGIDQLYQIETALNDMKNGGYDHK